MSNAVEIENPKARNSREVIHECKAYLEDLLAELDKPALERGEWKTPPDYMWPGGFWFSPASIGLPVPECDEHEEWRQKAIEALDSFLPEVPEDRRHGLVGRVLSPSIKKLPEDAKLMERVLELVGVPPDSEQERAWRLHAACNQHFRWDLQQRILAALDRMPGSYRDKPDACVIHLMHMQDKHRALQPAGRLLPTVNVKETDVGVAALRQIRGCSIDKAAEEVAAVEARLGTGIKWSSARALSDAIFSADALRREGAYPDFSEIRKQGEITELTKTAEKIAQGYKDRARKNGWAGYGLKSPLEVLMARPTKSTPDQQKEGSDTVAPEELGAFALAARRILSANLSEREQLATWLHRNLRGYVAAALGVYIDPSAR